MESRCEDILPYRCLTARWPNRGAPRTGRKVSETLRVVYFEDTKYS